MGSITPAKSIAASRVSVRLGQPVEGCEVEPHILARDTTGVCVCVSVCDCVSCAVFVSACACVCVCVANVLCLFWVANVWCLW